MIGNLLAVLDSLLYAIYGVLIYVLLPPDKQENYDFTLILGLIGLLTFLTGPIFLIAAHFSGIETIQTPEWSVVGLLSLDSIVGIGYEFWLVKATTMIGPLTANVSLAAIIPFTMVIDFLWNVHSYTAFYYLACVGIIIAVVSMNIEENLE